MKLSKAIAINPFKTKTVTLKLSLVLVCGWGEGWIQLTNTKILGLRKIIKNEQIGVGKSE
jgi:hypothetical protein